MSSAQTKKQITNDDIMEGFDTLAFMRWLQDECVIPNLEDDEVNHICKRWVAFRTKQQLEAIANR